MQIRWLGHASFALEHDGKTVLVDPWLTGNPKAAAAADDLEADAIFVTHAHVDHIGDVVPIAKRTGATVVAIVELAAELADEGIETIGPNIGGTVDLGFASVRYTPAWHTGTSPSGKTTATPAGIVVEMGDKRIYFLGDTGLFSDLALPKRRGHLDLAVIPIGGFYTMDRFDGVVAAEFVGADQVIPSHYGTFPPIETDAQAFKTDVEQAGFTQVIVLEPGQSHEL